MQNSYFVLIYVLVAGPPMVGELLKSVRSEKKKKNPASTPENSPKPIAVFAVSKSLEKPKKTGKFMMDVDRTIHFKDFLKQLNTFFHVTDGTTIRIGKTSAEEIDSFNGMDLATFIRDKG